SGLLKTWRWNPLNGSYDLFLDEGLTFHDGSSVTAQDLEFALLRGFFSKSQSFYKIYLGNILGVDKIEPGTPYRSGLVEGVKITSDHSVNVRLKNPNPSFLYSLTRPYFSFTKRAALNEDLLTWKKWPVGAGQYKVVSEDAESVTIEKTSASEKLKAKIILFTKAKKDMTYDISFFPTDQKMELFKTKNPSAIFTLFFTNQNDLSADSNFRNAVKFGVDRKKIADQDELIRPAYEFLSSSFWRNNESIEVSYDLAKAKDYFAKVPGRLRNKTWRIPVFSFGELSKITKNRTNFLTEQFVKFGLKVIFYPSTEKFLTKETATEAPMAYTGRICNNVDPLLLFSSFKTDSPYKYDNSQNDSKYDALFELAAKAVTSDDRVRTLRALSKYTIDHNFMVPLFEDIQYYYFNAATVMSFGNQTNAITLFLDQIVLK
ncbi:MAG: hypothetical protein H7235_06750, partial [Bdellovibrionaceae bacterium]|nr:hypothetical protein [Pseudobdellovibrionaceae bacterium]